MLKFLWSESGHDFQDVLPVHLAVIAWEAVGVLPLSRPRRFSLDGPRNREEPSILAFGRRVLVDHDTSSSKSCQEFHPRRRTRSRQCYWSSAELDTEKGKGSRSVAVGTEAHATVAGGRLECDHDLFVGLCRPERILKPVDFLESKGTADI